VVSERIPRNNLERAGLKIRIGELSNLPPYHPFEFHLADREEGEWFFKRIKRANRVLNRQYIVHCGDFG